MIHPCVDPPLCHCCQKQELSFFDPGCPDCRDILLNPNTTVPEIFAILRQWTPQTQHNIELLVNEIIKRGANINDRDGLTDMTLLHYASKSGAAGMGDADLAAKVVSYLLSEGADVNIRCRWTTMTALHYAAYFDVVPVIKVLLKATNALDIDSPCAEFDQGTVLHIAASNLAHEAIKVLLHNGANPSLQDDLNRLPVDCVPDSSSFDQSSDMAKLAVKVKKTLLEATPVCPKQPPPNYDLIQSKVTLQALGLKLGDNIVVGGTKTGTLQYCGPTEFASGVWAGIELDEPVGKNDGSIGGISYFKCPQNHGIFAPINKISKPGAVNAISRSINGSPLRSLFKPAVVKVDHVTAKVDTGRFKPKKMSSDVQTRLMDAERYFRKACEQIVQLNRRLDEMAKRYDKASRENHRSTMKFTIAAPSACYLITVWNYSYLSAGLSKSRASSIGDLGDINLEERVIVAGQRKGTVKFIGETKFASGTWYGIELDKPAGKNDGSVSCERYFTCQPRHGVFAPLSRIQNSNESLDTISWGAVSERLDRKSLGTQSFNLLPWSFTQSSDSKASAFDSWQCSSISLKLEVNMSVLCNNELGVIRYIGPTEFGDGNWLGVELRTAKGKNDGSVQGKRYFTCRPDHGLLVRPSRVSVRGINGAKLMGDNPADTHTNGDSPERF
ncbi:hypothetical protein LOTGIDRAFT_224824 [Lottia gigantea]|uniref:CAP-Gly domain-containing protein n=1 Tax=Lottia gigantea TaxID=225164 RepID=V4B9Z5_LOTGI|nr:hypothetical protein LOTGIDRAFT_224824 [Lottia gigantea]ESP02457.1 hypothetical protein LOTGIDRAFT_224824 [Lottia gigantea]